MLQVLNLFQGQRMMKRKLLFCLLSLFLLTAVQAQKKIIVEHIRCSSVQELTMLYCQLPETRKAFAGNLNIITQQYWHLPIADTGSLRWQLSANGAEKQKAVFNNPDSNLLHLFLDIRESAPATMYFYLDPQLIIDTNQVKQTKTVFHLTALLVNSRQQILLNKTLTLLVAEGDTPGIGMIADKVNISPKAFTEMLKTGLDILLNPGNEVEQVSMKASPAFVVDNVISPQIASQPRTYVAAKKDIAVYGHNQQQEMIRFGEAVYRKIKVRGRDADQLPKQIATAIKSAQDLSRSDFVFLQQESRDVVRDRNYLLQLLAQINPGASNEARFINFTPGNLNYLLRDKDTIAIFAIDRFVQEPGNKIFLAKVWNGFDSTSITRLWQREQWAPFQYNYTIGGMIGKNSFTIRSSPDNAVKIITYNARTVCIAQGKFMPERFVLFDASLSPELLNQLFIIGFTRFFESYN